MNKKYRRCCGIDVHKKLLVACFMQKGGKKETREFGATTSEILKLADWLTAGQCQMVSMESTGSYWKPVYNLFEARGLNCMVVNASHMKNVPGRKTDQADADWLCELTQYGLLTPSYIPDRQQRELRELVGYRTSVVANRSQELNRIQKVLEGGNIKLSGTIKDISGKSGMVLLNGLADGRTFTLDELQEMRKEHVLAPNLKASDEQLVEDLNGILTTNQRALLKEMLSHVSELDAHVVSLDAQINSLITEEQQLKADRIAEIPGIGPKSAQAVISVIGTDMSRFPNDSCISKWAGLCPGNNESAGKRKSGKTSKGNKLLRTTLVNCAQAAAKNKESYFSAQFARISAHRGKKRAIVAVAHSLLIAIYHVLKDDVSFVDLGSNYYDRFNREKKAKAYIKKLAQLGVKVVVQETSTATHSDDKVA